VGDWKFAFGLSYLLLRRAFLFFIFCGVVSISGSIASFVRFSIDYLRESHDRCCSAMLFVLSCWTRRLWDF
jgi:hypothetical protein